LLLARGEIGRGRWLDWLGGTGWGRGGERGRAGGGHPHARSCRDKVSGQGKAGGEGAKADVKGLQRRLKSKIHRVAARSQKDPAHDVIATEDGGGLLIHPQFPIGTDALVEQ